jgi:hypothetical protein
MRHGNVSPLRPLRPFPLIAGLPAHWYTLEKGSAGINHLLTNMNDQVSENLISA